LNKKKSNHITFARLESVLKELGFVKKVVPGTGVGYKHPPTGALVVVRLHKPREIVPDYVIVGVRHELEWQGVIEAKEFEEMLQAAAA
jgi:predicted RNA binding protein YcfA (HicA-like mRNA interferase family)